MKKINQYFADYESFHKNFKNKVTHLFGIPLIVLSLLGLLERVSFFENKLSLAVLVWALANAFYVMLEVRLGVTMIFSTAVLYALGAQIELMGQIALFVIGWVIQIWGHVQFEKKSPAFTKNLIHLLIGPLFIQNYCLNKWFKINFIK